MTEKTFWIVVERATGDEQFIAAWDNVDLNAQGYAQVRFSRAPTGLVELPASPRSESGRIVGKPLTLDERIEILRRRDPMLIGAVEEMIAALEARLAGQT